MQLKETAKFATDEFPWKFEGDGSPPDYQTFFYRKDNYFLAAESKRDYWDVSLRMVTVNGSYIWIFFGTASTKERAIRMCENVYLAYMNQQDKEEAMEDNPNDNISLINGKIRLVIENETKDLVENFIRNGVYVKKEAPNVLYIEPKNNGNIDPDDELAPRIHDLENGLEVIDSRLRSLEAKEESGSPLLERAINAIENILECPNMENMDEAKAVWGEYHGMQHP